jgi:hypothetical protein
MTRTPRCAKRPCLQGLAWRLASATLAVLFVLDNAAAAHGLGVSQLRLHVAGSRVEGEWEVDLHDARMALGLDPQVTGDPGWRDLRDHESALRRYVIDRLTLMADGMPCPLERTATPVQWQPDRGQVLLPVAATCASEPIRLFIRCDLLFELDPQYRAYYSVDDARVTHVGLFREDQRSTAIDVLHFHVGATIVEFVREGVRHVLSGLDHVFFLLALLLPAPLVRRDGAWHPGPGLRRTTREVFKVVTAFTLAHSLTLCLSFFGYVTPPSRWVEVGIAVSVFVAACSNLRPFLPGGAWTMALAFGLVHGLGFAGALRGLSLPTHARGLALGAFNAGVEIGQLVIVAVVLPVLVAASKRRWYRRGVLGAGSLVIAWLAVVWILERALNLSLLSPR